MKNELTKTFIDKVLKLDTDTFNASYDVMFKNISIVNKKTEHEIFMNIHEFIHTHSKDFLLSYAKGFKVVAETKYSDVDTRIVHLHFCIQLTVPNLLDGSNRCHVETFSGLSELSLYINAIEWLIKYRNDSPKLSKFWVNKF